MSSTPLPTSVVLPHVSTYIKHYSNRASAEKHHVGQSDEVRGGSVEGGGGGVWEGPRCEVTALKNDFSPETFNHPTHSLSPALPGLSLFIRAITCGGGPWEYAREWWKLQQESWLMWFWDQRRLQATHHDELWLFLTVMLQSKYDDELPKRVSQGKKLRNIWQQSVKKPPHLGENATDHEGISVVATGVLTIGIELTLSKLYSLLLPHNNKWLKERNE